MVGKTKPPTAPEKARMASIKDGHCLCCLLQGDERQATVQHVTAGFKRLGHRFTYGVCEWHHLGYPLPGHDNRTTAALIGPSLAHDKRAYCTRYGTELELVALADWYLEQKKAGQVRPADARNELDRIQSIAPP